MTRETWRNHDSIKALIERNSFAVQVPDIELSTFEGTLLELTDSLAICFTQSAAEMALIWAKYWVWTQYG